MAQKKQRTSSSHGSEVAANQIITEETKSAEATSSSSGKRTGDPFKDFDIDLKRIESDEEAVKYAKIGRESTYKFIDMLYRTDWHFEKKTNEGIKLYTLRNVAGEPDYARYETKFT